MKKIISILLTICVCFSSVLCFTSYATGSTTEYIYGNHAKNPMETEKSQGFTPVMTPVATNPEGSLDPDNLLVPYKQTALEENATRWGLKGEAWNGAAQWKNYTGIRSDGRINVDKCAAGVRFDVEVSGTYNVQADFFNNSPENGHYHYIFLKSGENKSTLYSFDTKTITATTDHNIAKGTMVQTYDLYLTAGDVLYFVVDSKGQGVSGVYKNLEVTINMTNADPVPATFEPAVLDEYSFGYTAKNILSEKGMQNFFPVFSGTSNKPDEFPIWNMIGSDKDPVSESDEWGSYTKWLNSTYEWAYVRSSGHIQPQKNTTAGVVWVAPKDGKYDINNTDIQFNIKEGATVSTMYYSVYYGNIATKEATRLFSYNSNSAESNEFSHTIDLKKGDRLYFIMDLADNSLNNAAPRIRLTIKPVDDTSDATDPIVPDGTDAIVPDGTDPILPDDYAKDFTPKTADIYTFGNKTKNEFATMGEQNFFPVFSKETNKKDDFPVWSMTSANQAVSVEENSNKWSNSDYLYAGVRADGRLAAEKCTLGVVWIAPADATYVYTTSVKYNGKATKSMYYSVYHGVADRSKATRLYVYDDSVDGDEGINEGTIELKKGDRLFFILDSNGQAMKSIYPHALVSIKEKEELELTIANSYSFGGRAANEFGTLGSQNFYPVAGPAAEKAEDYPLSKMVVCDELSVEENANRWGSASFEWLGVRADGRVYPSKYTAGVKWVAPTKDAYAFDAKFFGTQPKTGLIYGIYLKKTNGETKLLYSLDTKGETDERYEQATESIKDTVVLEKGDELYFLINSKGVGGSYYPYLRLSITPETKIPDTGDNSLNFPITVFAVASCACILLAIANKKKAR